MRDSEYYGRMITNDLDSFIKKYIEGYLLADLLTIKEKVPSDQHPGNAAYLMTSAVCSGIEFLGTLITTLAVIPGCDKCKKPEQLRNNYPLDHYCIEYLSRIDIRYKELGPVLRELIRNGIAHSFATKGKIGITRIGDRETTHLVRMTQEKFLIINADCLFDDFKKSYENYVLPDISKGGRMRPLAIENYERMKNMKSKEIDRTIQGMGNKLDDWPIIHENIEYMSRMVDEIEELGELQLIS